jgi:hypothetical protein
MIFNSVIKSCFHIMLMLERRGARTSIDCDVAFHLALSTHVELDRT